jgi:hypothetical protein
LNTYRVSAAAALFIAILSLQGIAVLPAFATSLGPRINEGSNQSLNWSGYAVTAASGSVSGVSGSWLVPSVTCNRQQTYAAFWAGIDGFNSGTVEQAGVLAQCSGGAAYYSAWYEFYPSPSVTISTLTVRPGDTVSVTVTYSGGVFYVTVTDGSQPSFSTSATVSGAARSSAECITERPSIGGSITKLADFGVVSFGQDYTGVSSTCYATISGVTGSFGSFGSSVQEITMVDNRLAVLAQPSPLSTDGSSFTVTWYRSS